MKLIRTIAAAVIGSVAFVQPVYADSFVGGDVTIVVPFKPGGAVDTTTRIIVQAANEAKLLGEYKFLVENIANSIVGQATPARARPDGRTILAMTSSVVTNPKIKKNVPFTLADYRPVAYYMIDPELIVVPANSPFQTIDDFVAAARGEGVSVVTSGAGTSHHMSGIAIRNRTDLKLNIVNVDAFGEQVQQIAGNHVQAALWSAGGARKQLEAGVIRVLATATRERLADMPDVPTWKEAGIDIDEFVTFRGWGVAVATPDDIVKDLANVLKTLSETESYAKAMGDAGYIVEFGDSERFGQVITGYSQLTDEIIAKASDKLKK